MPCGRSVKNRVSSQGDTCPCEGGQERLIGRERQYRNMNENSRTTNHVVDKLNNNSVTVAVRQMTTFLVVTNIYFRALCVLLIRNYSNTSDKVGFILI